MAKKVVIDIKTNYRDCTGQEFTIHQQNDTYTGIYLNQEGKPNFATNEEAVKKQLYFERWEKISQ